MFGLTSRTRTLLCVLSLMALPAAAQQDLPDSPKPKNPTPQNQFPEDAPPAPKNVHPDQSATAIATPTPQNPAARPAQNGIADRRDDLFKLNIVVNFVQVPVTVKDNSGRLVPGLGPNDFTVYEDG